MTLTDVFSYYGSIDFDPMPTKPWRLGSWIWATQGWLLVGLADDGREADPTPENKVKALQYLDGPLLTAALVQHDALRVFAGPLSTMLDDCESCHGTGRDSFGSSINCEHCGQPTRAECSDCGGDGKRGAPIRYGRVGGVLVNLSFLAFGLSLVPQDISVRVGAMYSPTTRDYHALVIVGETWRVVLMGCLESADPSRTAPVFMPELATPSPAVTQEPTP